MESLNTNQVQTHVQALAAIAEAIRELGEVPSGTLYAQVMGQFTLDQFQRLIGVLKRADIITESGHVLAWVGPNGGVK